MTSNETFLTVSIPDLIISEYLSFNIAPKHLVQESALFGNKSVKSLSASKQKASFQRSSGWTVWSEYGNQIEFDQERVRYFCIVISRWWCHNFHNSTVENIGYRGESSSSCIRTCWLPGTLSRWWGVIWDLYRCKIYWAHKKNWSSLVHHRCFQVWLSIKCKAWWWTFENSLSNYFTLYIYFSILFPKSQLWIRLLSWSSHRLDAGWHLKKEKARFFDAMHPDVHLSREPNTCIFQVLLAYFPHSCTQTCIFQVLLAYFPHSCTHTCIFQVLLAYFPHSCVCVIYVFMCATKLIIHHVISRDIARK